MEATESELLTSPQNTHVKELVKLRKDGNVRRKEGRFFIEGCRAVAAALDHAQAGIEELLVCDRLLGDGHALSERARESGCPVTRVSKDVFKKLADVQTPQGIAAVVKIPEWTLDDILDADQAIAMVACGVQDPGNLGAIIRSCEAGGASGLIMLEGTVDPYNAKVVRSTAGGLLTLPMVRITEAQLLQEVERRQAAKKTIRLVASGAEGGTPFKAFDWKNRPLLLCIGNEGAGLTDTIIRSCTDQVTIPLKGNSESLNAAVAASILLFEAQT